MADTRPHVVIIGAGFGGVAALKKLGNTDVRITMIDRVNYHLFQPLLYQLSTSVLSPEEIAFPIRAWCREYKNMDFFMAKATGIDGKNKVVHTEHGDVSYDYLIVATGATTNFFGMKSVQEHSYPMKTIAEASHIRDHVLHQFERANRCDDEAKRRQMLTFICVGGGATGVEEAGALTEMVNIQKKEFPNLNFNEVSVKLIEATDKVLPMMTPKQIQYTIDALRKKGVDVMLKTAVADCSSEGLTLKDGTFIPSKTVIWAAGIRAVKLASTIGVPCDRAGRLIVEKTLQVPGYPEIFCIGDTAHFMPDGAQRPLPTIAPVAYMGAWCAVENIQRMIKGNGKLKEFVYVDPGTMATIATGEACVRYKGKEYTGFFAWLMWMALHLLRLESGYADVTVCIKWIWNYLSGARLGRVITNVQIDDKHQA